jgi:hypothetical protein
LSGYVREYAYIFYVNPYGIQGDAILTSGVNEEKIYDLIWESSGVITDSGYQVEIAIPFSTLRFSKEKEQTWRVDFWRNHPRETAAEYSWAALAGPVSGEQSAVYRGCNRDGE